MPNTRKKVIKTVYKDEDDSEAENAAGDFSDSGSDAKISEQSESEEDEEVSDSSSGHEFNEKSRRKSAKSRPVRKTKFAKDFISKINRHISADAGSDGEQEDVAPSQFSVKNLSEKDKLLPTFLNLSESDSSDDESPKPTKKHVVLPSSSQNKNSESDADTTEYKDIWSGHIQDNSEEVAKKTFLELEQTKTKLEETKASVLNYSSKVNYEDTRVDDVKDLLALGEEVMPQPSHDRKRKEARKVKDDSESDMEDWEEVKESKGIPKQGLQLVVGIPDTVARKSKTLDIEMMMKRKINRVKKENQVYMHKVHVLCWIGHGNFVSRVLNDQEVLAAALSLVPSKECYPGARVDMKYVEQITTWYKDKLTLKQDKNENKYKPKAPPLKDILLTQVKTRTVTSKKYLVFIFVSMLRALGFKCRVMFNFVTLPIKPPTSELFSLSTKPKENKDKNDKGKQDDKNKSKITNKGGVTKRKSNIKISQVDGNNDESDSEFEDIMQLDGNDEVMTIKRRSVRSTRTEKKHACDTKENEDVSSPKRPRKSPNPKPGKTENKPAGNDKNDEIVVPQKRKKTNIKNQDGSGSKSSNQNVHNKSDRQNSDSPKLYQTRRQKNLNSNKLSNNVIEDQEKPKQLTNPRKTTKTSVNTNITNNLPKAGSEKQNNMEKATVRKNLNPTKILITNEDGQSNTSKHFDNDKTTSAVKRLSLNRKRSLTTTHTTSESMIKVEQTKTPKSRAKSAPESAEDKRKEKAFDVKKKIRRTSRQTKAEKPLEVAKRVSLRDLAKSKSSPESSEDKRKEKAFDVKKQIRRTSRQTKAEKPLEDAKRVSHRDLAKSKSKSKNDVTTDLVEIIKGRIKEAKANTRKSTVKAKLKKESDEDSDYLPEEAPKRRNSDSDDDFKPTKISPKPSTSRRIDRRVISSDDDTPKNRIDVWCEVFVEELEEWIAVDVIKGKAHCTNELYSGATHPVCYIVGWDNNNYLKDVTRRYVPHWNTITRKQRADPAWWDKVVQPWLGPKTARDREEDEQLNRAQLDAPLPKSIAEYKNHPLYVLQRHLLKYEAIYPPDSPTLGFVRNEPVYARECVHVCRSRPNWLKEAKVVRLGEKPYKVVRANPKWDRFSKKIILADEQPPMEVFGPWQVQDYEPPAAENGIVPRNEYGNVELFKDCMLPKGTVHIKLPNLNRVAKKLNIDCAPAMIGFDGNRGWPQLVFDGFVVCKEFEEIITEAWVTDQEDRERKEREKIEVRVYGNWKRLIKGLLIRERLKNKYGFEEPGTSKDKKAKGPRLVVKKNS